MPTFYPVILVVQREWATRFTQRNVGVQGKCGGFRDIRGAAEAGFPRRGSQRATTTRSSRQPATIKWEVRPALSTERMSDELSNAGSTFKQALVISRYEREFRLSNAPQRVLLDAIAPIAWLVAR